MALTIRPSEEMTTQLEEIKKYLEQKSSSKAIEIAVVGYMDLYEKNINLKHCLIERNDELEKIKDLIKKRHDLNEELNRIINNA